MAKQKQMKKAPMKSKVSKKEPKGMKEGSKKEEAYDKKYG